MTLLDTSNNPLYEKADSYEGNNRISTRPRRKVRPPKFYYEKLFKDNLGEQGRESAVFPFTLIEDTTSDHVAEKEHLFRRQPTGPLHFFQTLQWK